MNSTVSKLPDAPNTLPELPAPRASDRFWFGATAILILGIALRQIALGEASFHPDEAIHAHFGGGFAGYHYDPVFHGPLLYHLVAPLFSLFGQHDYTARLVPSLLGIGLLGLVLGPLREWIGARGALASAALLAVSPSIVCYSRRLLHDSLALFLTMGAVLCFVSALHHGADTSRGRQARIGIALFLTGFLATKANCFFIAAMLGAAYIGWRGAGWIAMPVALSRWIPLLLFVVISAVTIKYPVSFVDIPGSNPPLKMETPDHIAFKRVALGVCALFGFWLWTRPLNVAVKEEAALQKPEAPKATASKTMSKTAAKKSSTPKTASSKAAPQVVREKPEPKESGARSDEVSVEASAEVAARRGDIWLTYVLALGAALWLYVFLFGQGAQILTQWISSQEFPTQAFRDGGDNARLAIPKMLEYWGGQQGQPRLPGRHDYYLVLMLLYEVPILLAAIGGIWHASKHRTAFSDLLLWWGFSSWTVYALANEKVPWLLVHTVLPFALLGGLWLGQIKWKKPVLATALALGLAFSMRGTSAISFERAGDNIEPLLYAQTPEVFRDALRQTLVETRGDERGVWMAGEKQWPSVWYLRPGGPDMGKSGSPIEAPGVLPMPADLRAAIAEEGKSWPVLQKAGWRGQTVDFLIWPRASWTALEPRRYWRWFWTRETLPQSERNLPQTEWKTSILGGQGEWSHAVAVVAQPPK